ncbi:MAG: HAD hydrolase-like protein [Muribaculaceae bacterium]|nr:HAD hydrolase-like protein [Muribaculaceae bacterium]
MDKKIAQSIEHWKQRTGYTLLDVKAALIDMDGTLYDSMRNHTASWYRLMTEQGIDCTRDEFYLYEGMTGASTITRLWKRQWDKTPTPEEIKELYHRKTLYFNEFPKVDPMPGAQNMVAGLMSNGITTVLVTGSGQPSVLDRLATDYPGAFTDNHRVTARNVTHGKPHPEPYLKGMEMAAVEPWQAMAIENAPIGVESAVASGAFTIALTTGPIPTETLAAAGADLVLPSMQALDDILPILLPLISDKK